MLKLTRAGDYAVRAILYLAVQPDGDRCDREKMAQAQEIPLSFLSKILQRLTAAGIIRSYKGACGGFCLARPADSITLLEVVQAVEGPLALNACLFDGETCHRRSTCPAHLVWADLQGEVKKALASVTFAQLAQSLLNGNGRR